MAPTTPAAAGPAGEGLLTACRYFDRECAGYLLDEDLEEIAYMVSEDLSRESWIGHPSQQCHASSQAMTGLGLAALARGRRRHSGCRAAGGSPVHRAPPPARLRPLHPFFYYALVAEHCRRCPTKLQLAC